MNAADLGRGHNHDLGSMAGKPRFDLGLLSQIAVGAGRCQNLLLPSLKQSADKRCTHHATVARDKNRRLKR
jgi:hypothetical protein